MTNPAESHNPYFQLYPINTSITGWQDIGLPVILAIPHMTEPNGQIWGLRIYIENVPQNAYIAGHQHIGARFPDKELYSVNIDALTLADNKIDLTQTTLTPDNKHINYTTKTGITSTIPVNPNNTTYYDLSTITLDIEQLPKNTYNITYQLNHYNRNYNNLTDTTCIDTTTPTHQKLTFGFNHPGDIIYNIWKHTPATYLTTTQKKTDQLIKLLRTLTEPLQDIHDEQNLLTNTNWIYKLTPEIIPYISTLLGWDLPYTPTTTDNTRQAMLRRTTHLQKHKSSYKAIEELFNILGYNIEINHLYITPDGKQIITPNQKQPKKYQQYNITTTDKTTTDNLLNNHPPQTTPTTITIPLNNKPTTNITIDINYPQPDSTTAKLTEELNNKLKNKSITIEYLIDNDNTINPLTIQQQIPTNTPTTQLTITTNQTPNKITQTAQTNTTQTPQPINTNNITYNKHNNTITINLPPTTTNTNIYATYNYKHTNIPPTLTNNQSNKFTIKLTPKQNPEDGPNTTTLQTATETLLTKLKAFHSQLHHIQTNQTNTENYETNDLCTDPQTPYNLNNLQVPPPQPPTTSTTCQPTTTNTPTDKLKQQKHKLLEEETTTTNKLNNRQPHPTPQKIPTNTTPSGQHKTNQTPTIEITLYTQTPTPNTNTLNNHQTINTHKPPKPTTTTNKNTKTHGAYTQEETQPKPTWTPGTHPCYQGRIKDTLQTKNTITLTQPTPQTTTQTNLGTHHYTQTKNKQLKTNSKPTTNPPNTKTQTQNPPTTTLHIPNTTHPTLSKQAQTTTQTIPAKPWDNNPCTQTPPWTLTTKPNGNQQLNITYQPYTTKKTNQPNNTPIIPNLTNNTTTTPHQYIIHTIYIENTSPYTQPTNTTNYNPTTQPTNTTQTQHYTTTTKNTNTTTTTYTDQTQGTPATTAPTTHQHTETKPQYTTILTQLGMPTPPTTPQTQILTLNTGIYNPKQNNPQPRLNNPHTPNTDQTTTQTDQTTIKTTNTLTQKTNTTTKQLNQTTTLT